MTDPFSYPPSAHVRRHGPQDYADYADYAGYRPWLRDEFTFRCVYCLLREQWGVIRGTFAVEHFLPVAIHPSLRATYDNLVYSCVRCNGAKGLLHVPDPCQVLLRHDLRILDDGSIEARTPEAQRTVRVLGLNDPEPRELRLLWLRIVALVHQHDPALYRKLMGYPTDLPQLSRLRPPGGNTRPEGVQESCYARRQDGTLPDIC